MSFRQTKAPAFASIGGGVQLNNRILRAATHEGLAGENGAPTEQLIKLYERLSKGGVGAIITGFIGVSEESRLADPGMSLLDSDDKIPVYAEMTDRVHQAGGVIIAQLAHCGASSKMGKAGRPDNITSEQILKIEDDFAKAAKRAKAAINVSISKLLLDHIGETTLAALLYARHLYERLGFKQLGTIPGGFRMILTPLF